jgi:hypothetical protein
MEDDVGDNLNVTYNFIEEQRERQFLGEDASKSTISTVPQRGGLFLHSHASNVLLSNTAEGHELETRVVKKKSPAYAVKIELSAPLWCSQAFKPYQES